MQNLRPQALIGLPGELRLPAELPGATGNDNPEKEEFTLEEEQEEEEEEGEEKENSAGGQYTVRCCVHWNSPKPSQKRNCHLWTGSVGFYVAHERACRRNRATQVIIRAGEVSARSHVSVMVAEIHVFSCSRSSPRLHYVYLLCVQLLLLLICLLWHMRGSLWRVVSCFSAAIIIFFLLLSSLLLLCFYPPSNRDTNATSENKFGQV